MFLVHGAADRIVVCGVDNLRYRARLQSEPDAMATFDKQHQSFADERWALLSEPDRKYAEASGFAASLRDSGVSGVAYRPQVKCLHAHFAHFLATGDNIVGEWTQKALAEGFDAQAGTTEADQV